MVRAQEARRDTGSECRKRAEWKAKNTTDSYFKTLFAISVNQEKGESHLLEWPSLKSLQIMNSGEGMEKQEHPYIFGEDVNWCSHCGEQQGGSLKN